MTSAETSLRLLGLEIELLGLVVECERKMCLSHVVFRSGESGADVPEAEAQSGQEAGAGVDEGGALVAGAGCQLQCDEQSEAAEEGELRDQQPQPLHSSPTNHDNDLYFSVVVVVSGE